LVKRYKIEKKAKQYEDGVKNKMAAQENRKCVLDNFRIKVGQHYKFTRFRSRSLPFDL